MRIIKDIKDAGWSGAMLGAIVVAGMIGICAGMACMLESCGSGADEANPNLTIRVVDCNGSQLLDIVEITWGKETHEFVRIHNDMGMAHWPGCKYCKGEKSQADTAYSPIPGEVTEYGCRSDVQLKLKGN